MDNKIHHVIKTIDTARRTGEKISHQLVKEQADQEERRKYEKIIANELMARAKKCYKGQQKAHCYWFDMECAELTARKLLAAQLVKDYGTPVARNLYTELRTIERIHVRRVRKTYKKAKMLRRPKIDLNPERYRYVRVEKQQHHS